mgnify:CR=1 FL=1
MAAYLLFLCNYANETNWPHFGFRKKKGTVNSIAIMKEVYYTAMSVE